MLATTFPSVRRKQGGKTDHVVLNRLDGATKTPPRRLILFLGCGAQVSNSNMQRGRCWGVMANAEMDKQVGNKRTLMAEF